MKRHSLKAWVGAGLLGATLAAGCNSAGKQRPVAQGHVRVPLGAGQVVVSPHAQGPLATEDPKKLPPVTETTEPPLPAEEIKTVKTEPSGPPPAPEAEAKSSSPVEPADLQPFKGDAEFPRHEGPAKRRSYVDITASQAFGHAEDYSWLCGRVEHSRLSKGWRLRYASVDEADRYGGSVTLMDDGNLQDLKDGMIVRVRGRLSDPEAGGSSPPYRVSAIEPMGGE